MPLYLDIEWWQQGPDHMISVWIKCRTRLVKMTPVASGKRPLNFVSNIPKAETEWTTLYNNPTKPYIKRDVNRNFVLFVYFAYHCFRYRCSFCFPLDLYWGLNLITATVRPIRVFIYTLRRACIFFVWWLLIFLGSHLSLLSPEKFQIQLLNGRNNIEYPRTIHSAAVHHSASA